MSYWDGVIDTLLAYAYIHTTHTYAHTNRHTHTRVCVCDYKNTDFVLQEVVELFSQRGIRSVSVYGGVSRRPQEDKLMYGVEICVATPGRLNDLLRSGSTNLNRCTFLVSVINFLKHSNKVHT